MLDYASLAAVAAVIQEGSFERAARLLNVTPSAISQRIKLLEERIGSTLVVRGQPCTATAAGNLICRHLERVGMLELDLQESLPQLLQATGRGDRLTLRIGVNADSLGSWFLTAMSAFTEKESALLDVMIEDEEHTIDRLKSGEVLAAITSQSQPAQGCNSVELGNLRYRAVASPDFVHKYFSGGVTAAALASAPALRFNHKDQMQAQWIRAHVGTDVPAPSHWLPSTQAFLDASLAGIGWCLNPELLIQKHLRSGALVEILPATFLDVPLYWQHTRLKVPTLERLTGAVTRAAAELLLQT